MTDPSTAEQAQAHNDTDTKEVIVSPALPSSPDSNAATRVLRKGDLVRVAERYVDMTVNAMTFAPSSCWKRLAHSSLPFILSLFRREPRMKNRDGGLGRIYRSVATNDDEGDDHPFRYDVDFVLGGRITNVERKDLLYTTADAEGMTERRKRNPSAVVKEAQEAKHVKPALKTKSATTKAATKTARKAKGSAGAKHKGKNGKAAGKKGSGKQQKEAKAKSKEEVVVVKDLYEPHRREFEKCLVRLEKQDTYGFFLGDPLPEHDEHYENLEQEEPKGSIEENSAHSTPVTAAHPSAQPRSSTPAKPSGHVPMFPDTPPFNFAVIRKRLKHGRYVLDRARQQKERFFSSSRTAPDLIHPKGVHWDLFRDDVIKMCDAAISRDPDGISGGRGTLGHAANKTKNVSRVYAFITLCGVLALLTVLTLASCENI